VYLPPKALAVIKKSHCCSLSFVPHKRTSAHSNLYTQKKGHEVPCALHEVDNSLWVVLFWKPKEVIG